MEEENILEQETKQEPEEEKYDIPRLTGNYIEIVGNSFCGACHAERADDFQLADDIRMARQTMLDALFPEIKSFEYWCVFKHLCSLIVDSYEQIYKNKRNGDPVEGAFKALKMYLNRAKYVWAAMLTNDEEFARKYAKPEGEK